MGGLARRPAGRRRAIPPASLAAILALMVGACATPASTPPASAAGSPDLDPAKSGESGPPEWYGMGLTDVRTGAEFTVGEFEGKLVLIETMAIWCPTCIVQAAEVRRFHDLLDDPEDVVSISLDVDLNEDAASLREYATETDIDWRIAVAPLLVARALGNLYSAQYLNPPLSPMLVIDRHGTAVQLPYGVKKAEDLLELLDPYLAG